MYGYIYQSIYHKTNYVCVYTYMKNIIAFVTKGSICSNFSSINSSAGSWVPAIQQWHSSANFYQVSREYKLQTPVQGQWHLSKMWKTLIFLLLFQSFQHLQNYFLAYNLWLIYLECLLDYIHWLMHIIYIYTW